MNPFVITLLVILSVFLITVLFGAPYVPSHSKELKFLFNRFYRVNNDSLIIDLGSGDGKVLAAANRHGAKGIGIEINPLLCLISKLRFRKNPDIKIVMQDMFRYKFPDETTAVYVFGDGRDMKRIVHYVERQAERIGHPIDLISNAFELKGYTAEKHERAYFLYKIGGKK